MDRDRAATLESPMLPVPESDFRAERLERITARAYDLYEARGGEYGKDLDDWLQAEQQIDDEIRRLDRED
jgi:hypothetical protein